MYSSWRCCQRLVFVELLPPPPSCSPGCTSGITLGASSDGLRLSHLINGSFTAAPTTPTHVCHCVKNDWPHASASKVVLVQATFCLCEQDCAGASKVVLVQARLCWCKQCFAYAVGLTNARLCWCMCDVLLLQKKKDSADAIEASSIRLIQVEC